MSNKEAVAMVQEKLNEMNDLHLGAMLAECDRLISATDSDDLTRKTARVMRLQVLAAFAHKTDVQKANGTYDWPTNLGGRVQ
jgi:hypothetical protein